MDRLYLVKRDFLVGTNNTNGIMTLRQGNLIRIRKRKYRQLWWLIINNNKYELNSYEYGELIKKKNVQKLPNTAMAEIIYG